TVIDIEIVIPFPDARPLLAAVKKLTQRICGCMLRYVISCHRPFKITLVPSLDCPPLRRWQFHHSENAANKPSGSCHLFDLRQKGSGSFFLKAHRGRSLEIVPEIFGYTVRVMANSI